MGIFSKLFHKRINRFPELLVASRKLDLALKDFGCVRLKNDILHQRSKTLERRILGVHLTDSELSAGHIDTTLWPCIWSEITKTADRGREFTTRTTDLATRALSLAIDNITLQHGWISAQRIDQYQALSYRQFVTWCVRSSETDPLIRNLFFLEGHLQEAVEASGAIRHYMSKREVRENPSEVSSHLKYTIPGLSLTCFFSTSLCVFKFRETHWLLPRDYLLLMHNKVCDIISVLLLAKCSQLSCYEEDTYALTIEFLNALAVLARRYKNDYFDIAKCVEGLVIGEIIDAEEHWKNRGLLTAIETDLMDIGFDYPNSAIRDVLVRCSTPLKNELACLAKTMGHPIVDIEGTAEKAYTRATRELNINLFAIQTTRNIAVETLVRNYIMKHGRWPPATLDPHGHPALLHAYNENKDPYSDKYKIYGPLTSNDFVYVEIEKSLELDRLYHYPQYLKDRTITPPRSFVENLYFKHTVRDDLHRMNSLKDWIASRLLLTYLCTPNDLLNIQGYLSDYELSDDDMRDVWQYLVIKLVPKEKELKIFARPFGCKTYQDRYRSKVQEENVVSYMDNYLQDQAMTLDHLSLVKKMYSFRNILRAYKGWRVLYINFDVSGWCGNFRHETVAPVVDDTLGKLYGSDIFRKTQKAYENGLFYIPNEQGAYGWEGQSGGIEGLNQDTWMAVYIPQMQYALREFQLHFFVMAYGDDYKAALLIPPTESGLDLNTLRERVVAVVARSAITNFGQQMKLFDSYGSEVFISFCKNASVSSIELPQGFRKIQKCYGATNAFLPCVDDYIASAYSNAHSAARTMPTSYGSYIVACVWTYYHLLTSELWANASDNELHYQALVPSVLGGMPIIYLHNFFTRAENDHLTAFVDLTKYIRDVRPDLGTVLIKAYVIEVQQPPDLEGLCRDPYSIPLVKPPLPSTVFRTILKTTLRPIIRNEEMLELLDMEEDPWSLQLITALKTVDPLHPRIMNSIYSCTPVALIDELYRKFENAHSIKDLLVMRKGKGPMRKSLRKVHRADIKLQQWRYDKAKGLVDGRNLWAVVEPWCPVVLADALRYLWGRRMIGITMPPVQHLTVAVPSQAGMGDPFSESNHFQYTVSQDSTKTLKRGVSDHWIIGAFKPFLGHATRLGAEIPQVRLVEKNPLMSKIRTLLDLVSWVDKAVVRPDGTAVVSNLREVIYLLLQRFYTQDPTILTPLGHQRRGGTTTHHWRSEHYRESIVPNCLYNTYTLVKGEANSHRRFRMSSDHYNINFLQIFCHSVHLLTQELEYQRRLHGSGTYWVITRECAICDRPIEDTPLVVNRLLLPAVPTQRLLRGTNLDKVSAQAITDALGEWDKRRYKTQILVHNLDLKVAAKGVCQQFIYQTHTTDMKIATRYGAPMLSSEGRKILSSWSLGHENKLVRQREIRGCPIGDLTSGLHEFIWDWSRSRFSNRGSPTIAAFLSTMNVDDMPWMVLVEQIWEAGVLTHVIEQSKRVTGIIPPVCYDSPHAASRYIGICAYQAGERGLLESSGVVLSYYEDDHILDLVKRKFRVYEKRLLEAVIRPELRLAIQNNDLEKCTIIQCALLYYYSAPLLSDEEILDVLTDNNDQEINITPREMVDYDADLIEFLLTEHESEITLVQERLRNAHEWIIDVQLDDLQDHEDKACRLVLVWMNKVKPVHLVRSTIADCVASVRENPDPLRVDYTLGQFNRSRGEITARFALTGRSPKVTVMRGHDMPTHNVMAPAVTDTVMPSTEQLVSLHSMCRVYGAGVTSISKFIEIFSLIGLDTRTLSNKNIMMLGEGQGGCLNGIAELGRNCHIFYNTLPHSSSGHTLPNIALQSIRDGDHYVDCSLVNQGVYDLSDKHVADRIVKYDTRRYHLLTCDAEADWRDHGRYRHMIHNVIRIFLEKSSGGSIMIIKVMIDILPVIDEALTVIRHYCETTWVMRLSGSPPGGEVYITATGRRRVFLEYPRHIVTSPEVQRRVGTLHANIKSELERKLGHKNYDITPVYPGHVTYLRVFAGILTPAVYQIIEGRYSVLLKQSYSHKVRQGCNIDKCLTLLQRDLQEWEFLTRHIYTSLPSTETAASVVHHGYSWLRAISLLIYSDIFLVEELRTLHHQDIRQEFVNQVVRLLPRCAVTITERVFEGPQTINGVNIDLYQAWIDGLDWCLTMRTWVMVCSTNQQETNQ